MTDYAKRYKLSDAARQRRLDEFASQLSPSDLRTELAACRLTLESLLSAPNPSPAMIGNLLTVAGKLAAAHTAIQERSNEVVGRDELTVFTRNVIDAVWSGISDLPDANDRMDKIIVAISDMERYEPKPKLLALEESHQ